MKKKSQTGRPIQLEQWIEVRVEDGKTVSTFYPPNEEIVQSLAKMNPKPDLIYRRLNFVDGVPDEYRWAKTPATFQMYGGMFVQRILPEEWPRLRAEELVGKGHAKKALYPQPRPESWGPCPCPECTKERETTPGKSRYDRFSVIQRDESGRMIAPK